MSTWKYFVKLSKDDNVVTLTRDASFNTVMVVGSEKITVKQDTPFGHKVAIKKIEKGENVIKFGVKIGVANSEIKKGAHVHIHNVDEVSLQIRDEERARSLER